jgi:hypothetical protein
MICPHCGYDDNGKKTYCCRKSMGQEEEAKPAWPLFIVGISWLRTKEDIGVGDTVKHALSYMGGDQFKWVMARLGVDCGCGSRQEWLNRVYPYE